MEPPKREEENHNELPPSYEHATSSNAQNSGNQKDDRNNEEKLPPYEQFSKGNLPPSYKADPNFGHEDIRVNLDDFFPPMNQHNIVMVEEEGNPLPHNSASDECMFWSSLWISVLFNWIGFFIGYCLIGTEASRSGCIAGLGLSLINCLLYTKNSHFSDEDASGGFSVFYVWWLLLILSILMVFRGFIEGARLRNKRREQNSSVDQAQVY